MPIVAANIKRTEIKTLKEILRKTQEVENFADENSINEGSRALHYEMLLTEILNANRLNFNIHIEGANNIRAVNEARTFINEHYNREIYPLEPIIDEVEVSSSGSFLSILGYIFCCGWMYAQEDPLGKGVDLYKQHDGEV